MLAREGKKAIVNMSSGNGMVGVAGLSAYTAAKHAVIGLTRSAALEVAELDIRINAVAPGYVETPKVLALGEEALAAFRERPSDEAVGQTRGSGQLGRVFAVGGE